MKKALVSALHRKLSSSLPRTVKGEKYPQCPVQALEIGILPEATLVLWKPNRAFAAAEYLGDLLPGFPVM